MPLPLALPRTTCKDLGQTSTLAHDPQCIMPFKFPWINGICHTSIFEPSGGGKKKVLGRVCSGPHILFNERCRVKNEIS